ncbi:MAG: glycosyltransferase [Micropruina sp.]
MYNEAADLERSIRRLTAFLAEALPYRHRVTIADNASTDDTLAIAHRLAAEVDGVRVVHLEARDETRALKQTWLASDADVVAYMDVDLSTGQRAAAAAGPARQRALGRGDRHPAGPRLPGRPGPEAGVHLAHLQPDPAGDAAGVVQRRPVRLQGHAADVAQRLLPLVEDTNWFFDTELLVLASGPCGSTRCRWTGPTIRAHRRHRGHRRRDLRSVWRLLLRGLAAAGSRSGRCVPNWPAGRPHPAGGTGQGAVGFRAAGAIRGDRGGVHAGPRRALPCSGRL